MAWKALFAALMSLLAAAPAESQHVDRVVILERGIYQAHAVDSYRQPGALGAINRLRDIRLVRGTTNIPARRSTRFGLRYVLEGSPRGAAVEIKLVTRFPEGGLREPDSDRSRLKSEYVLPVEIGKRNYREFHLYEDWEFVPGVWIFEFWHGDRKLGEQAFCVFEPPEDVPGGHHGGGCLQVIG